MQLICSSDTVQCHQGSLHVTRAYSQEVCQICARCVATGGTVSSSTKDKFAAAAGISTNMHLCGSMPQTGRLARNVSNAAAPPDHHVRAGLKGPPGLLAVLRQQVPCSTLCSVLLTMLCFLLLAGLCLALLADMTLCEECSMLACIQAKYHGRLHRQRIKASLWLANMIHVQPTLMS